MHPIKLSENCKNPRFIRADKIFYPSEKTAFYQNNNFGNQRLDASPTVISCFQIEENYYIEELAYYRWTLEKIRRLGNEYEKFLFATGKGCKISSDRFETFLDLREKERQAKIAKLTTIEFINLYKKIKSNWDISLSGNTIYFYKTFTGKIIIGEGRHRVCILYFLNKYYFKSQNVLFVIDKSFIKMPYCYYKTKATLRKIIKSVLFHTKK